MKNKKRNIIIITISLLIIVIGLTYALMTGTYFSSGKNISISGDIYMHFNGSDAIQLSNAIPMNKEEALEKTDDYFEFTIIGKNTSEKDIYYGISLVKGEVPSGKTNVNESDIMVYLLSGEDILVDGVRYQDFKNPMYVDKINAGTNSEISKNYKMKVWLREGIIVSDTEDYASYTTSEWENLYMSLKVKVEANMNYMNIPLTIEHDNGSVENNKQFFITRVSNYLNPEEVGEMLDNNDNMTLEITSDSDNIEFTYKDSTGNEVTEASDTITINYTFNKKQSEEVQVFAIPKDDSNTNTDINVKLTKNNLEVYEQVINMDIKGNNYCLNNGFEKLGDCILVSEIQSKSVSDAKTYINSKTYNLDDTAPSYAYVEEIEYNVQNVYSVNAISFAFADSYEFNETTGFFKLINQDNSEVKLDGLNDKYINYYTCGANSRDIEHCETVYLIKKTMVTENFYTISLGDKITRKLSSALRSQNGLYKTIDDYGDTYIFRGDVENNNVFFAGFYWKILRTNGDNSIRLIYNGEKSTSIGSETSINNTNYAYSSNIRHDPTYVGYMYGKNFAIQTSLEYWYDNFNAQANYYWADSYEFNEETEKFHLKSENLELVNGTFSEMQDNYDKYPYTCSDTPGVIECEMIIKVKNFTDATKTATVQYISYSSTSTDGTRTNEMSSNAKIELEKWYENNMINKRDEYGNLITDYISDGTFCNDRGMSTGDGYNLVPETWFSSYTRLGSAINGEIERKAFLKCGDDIRDRFSATTSKGNGLLTYPIGLLTVDEIALAGGKYQVINEEFYLYSNNHFFTMSPAMFPSQNASSLIWFVLPNGSLTIWDYVSSTMGLRPVINLSPDVLISSGDGTISNPFKLKLA